MAFHINAKKAAGVGRLKAPKTPLFASTALASAMLIAAPAMAQDAAFAPASMVEQAQTGETQDFSIAPQPLVSALDQFSEQTGVAFAYTASQLEGLQAQGVTGTFTPRAALNRLLIGTGVTFEFTGANTVAVKKVEQQENRPPQLGPITVEGELEGDPADVPFMTPGSSAYISLEQIERIPPNSPGDIFKEVPGVLSGASNDGTSINVNIRSSQGLNRVRTMVEGTQQESSNYQGYAGADQRTYIDPDLIGGVEISKGPGGGPYGTGTTSGIVNVRLLDADDLVPEGDSFGFRLRGGVAGNAKTPQFLERQIFTRGADTGLRERDGNDFLTDDNWFGSIAGAYRSERFELVGAFAKRKEGNYFAGRNGSQTYSFFRDAGRGPERQQERFSNVEPGQEVPNTSEDTSSFLLKGALHFQDGHSLEAGYTRYDSEFGQVFPSSLNISPPQQYSLSEVESDRYWLRYKWASANDLIDLQVNLWRTAADELDERRQGTQENNAWGAEVWNTSFFDTGLGGLTLTYGAEYAKSEAVVNAETVLSGFQYVPGQDPSRVQFALSPAFDGSREVYGGYLNAVFEPTDWLTLNAGVRYDGFRAESTSAGYRCDVDFTEVDELNLLYAEAEARAFDAPTFEEFLRLWAEAEAILIQLDTASNSLDGYCGGSSLESKNDGDRVSPRVGVMLEPIDGLQFFAQYSEGFRALSLVELGQTFAAPVIVNPDLEPEVVKTWEIGANYLRDGVFFDDDALRAKLVYFNNDYDNYIARVGELDVRDRSFFFFENVPDVTVSGYEASLGYDAGRVFADLNVNMFDQDFDTFTQASIQQPEYAGTVTVGTRWFDESLTLGGRLTFFGELPMDDVLESEVFSEARFYWSSQEIFDLFGSYQVNDHLALGFSIENVTDRYYMPPLFVSRIPAPGRTFRVHLTARF